MGYQIIISFTSKLNPLSNSYYIFYVFLFSYPYIISYPRYGVLILVCPYLISLLRKRRYLPYMFLASTLLLVHFAAVIFLFFLSLISYCRFSSILKFLTELRLKLMSFPKLFLYYFILVLYCFLDYFTPIKYRLSLIPITS